ncbi:MAG: MarR family transcriptional regulator [Cyanobacteria bacterium J069]
MSIETIPQNPPEIRLSEAHNRAWRLFLTVSLRLGDRVDTAFSNAKLPSMEAYDVLFTLKKAPDYRLRLSDLADQILLSRSNLTRLCDRLETAGLLVRESCPSDRRGTYAVLTPAGLDMQAQMWSVYSAVIATHFAQHLTEADTETMQRVCGQMLEGLTSQR